MPVFTESPLTPSLPQPDVIKAFKPRYKTAVVDTRYTPQSDLLAYIEGSTWVVDYYSQILDQHDELGGQDVSLPNPLKQYRRIHSLELKVTQDLSQISPDAQTGEDTLNGEANVYPFLVPQVGDMFRAGIADGREGLFQVTAVSPKQLFTDRVHSIEYQLIAANDERRIYDLDQKTLVTYYFVKDFLLNLQNPLLEEADYHAAKQLEAFYYDLAYLYFKQYFSRETMTLIVPGQSGYIYDHGLTDFVTTIFQSTDDVHVSSIRQLNIGDDNVINAMNLWQMLINRDPKMFKYIYTKTGLVGRNQFHRSALMAGMRYTGIAQVVYPLNPQADVDTVNGINCLKSTDVNNIVSKMPVFIPSLPNTPMQPYRPIDMNDGYVLSQAFYTRQTTDLVLLEKLILDYLDFKLIPAKDILTLCDAVPTMGAVEKFYYIPLIILLIRYHLRRL